MRRPLPALVDVEVGTVELVAVSDPLFGRTRPSRSVPRVERYDGGATAQDHHGPGSLWPVLWPRGASMSSDEYVADPGELDQAVPDAATAMAQW